ncbi:HAD family hydrolase [candidate division KSB1 bacterium]|nr:HAD family hydrolase [candidate division KSB1 bacterium]
MGSIKLIIFDLDGTLVHTAQDVHDSVNLTLKEMGLPKVTFEQTKKALGPGPAFFSKIILGEDNTHRFDEYRDIFRPIYLERCLYKTKPFPGITELLKKLSDYKLAVATNKPSNSTNLILDGLNLKSYFHLIVGADLVEHTKPHPDMIYYICSELQVPPQETMLIGDTDNDILAANSSGAYSCLAGWGYSSDKENLSIISDFHIDQPQDVLEILERKNIPEKKIINIGL